MKKRKAARIAPIPPRITIFITEVNGKILYCVVDTYASIYTTDGIIEAARQIKKIWDNLHTYSMYAVSVNLKYYGRLNRELICATSSLNNAALVASMQKIYNWINGHSLQCLPTGHPSPGAVQMFKNALHIYKENDC